MPPKIASRNAPTAIPTGPVLASLTELQGLIRVPVPSPASGILISGAKLAGQAKGAMMRAADVTTSEGVLNAVSGEVIAQIQSLLLEQSPRARRIRLLLVKELVSVEQQEKPHPATVNQQEDEVLTTAQAAEILACSRPYVSMLVDRGALAGAEVTEGGHRRIPRSSVLAYKAAHVWKGDSDYRKAARDAGMYAIPEAAYLAAAERKPAKRMARKAARKK